MPFVWNYFGQRLDYELLSGVVAVQQDEETGCLSPKIGWAVRPATNHALADEALANAQTDDSNVDEADLDLPADL